MNQQAELTSHLQRLEQLLGQVGQMPDPAARATLQEIIQGVMEFHGAAIARLLEIVGPRLPAGILEDAGRDDLVSSLLALYDLHPVDLETRIERALDQSRPYLKSHGGAVELVGVYGHSVKLRMTGSCNGCPSSLLTVKGSIEESIRAMIPEIDNIEVEGLTAEPVAIGAQGFVPLAVLSGTNGNGRPH
jgi:Fe-S cluster biogenesis protein NfuA